MTLTWPQLIAYLELNKTLDRIEQADALLVAAMGAQGDGKAIEKTLMELARGNPD
jgi:hypothetical protein